MKKIITLACALSLVGLSGASAQVIYKTVNSAELQFGYMGVRELSNNAFVSGGSWALTNLTAEFTAPQSLVLSPATATNALWYNPPGGGDGSLGNKNMTAMLFGQSIGTLGGQTLVFEGNVTDFSLSTNAAGIPYTLTAIIKDFAPNYASVVQTIIPISSSGNFSLSQSLLPDANRIVQWGFQMTGPNIWPGDTVQLDNAGSVTVIPEPTTYALLGLAALGGLLAGRFRRKA